MSATFDPEQGVLRLSPTALSVLGRLAADPTDPTLRDHATAPPLAALRAAGVLSDRGVDPDVAPLAHAVGAPRATFALTIRGEGQVRRCLGWVGADVTVVAVPTAPGGDEVDLVADRPGALAALVGDLVGLAAGGGADGAPVELTAEAVAALRAGRPAGGVDQVDLAWALDHPGGRLCVVDAGPAGLLLVDDDPPRATPVSVATVRRRLTELAR